MPRIRTFKPEFFRSPDTAKASPRARILYMAMWSWANDEGIGETNLYGLLGFAFPDSDNVTVEDFQGLLAEVGGSYGVQFYEHRGRFYYAIPSWNSHQKTERRAAGRFPKPDAPDSRPDLRFGNSANSEGFSEATQGKTPVGTGEQGNTGTGETSTSATEVCHQGADHVAPPPEKCPRHLNDENPPSCGACASRRRARDKWEREQAQAAGERAAAEAAEKAAAREIAKNCPWCHGTGNREINDDLVEKCDHKAPDRVGATL